MGFHTNNEEVGKVNKEVMIVTGAGQISMAIARRLGYGKKIILLLALCFTANNFFAQTTDPNQLKNEGNDALNAKNYAVAFEKYSEYLKLTNNQDSVTAYNCGLFADNIKKYKEAADYFDNAIKKNYNLANAYIVLFCFLDIANLLEFLYFFQLFNSI